MDTNWITSPYRTETIVFNFRDEQAFKTFWRDYIETGIDKGVSYSSISTGDRRQLLEKCQDFLYVAAERIDDWELSEKMTKLAEE
jgi:hypothetical protein